MKCWEHLAVSALLNEHVTLQNRNNVVSRCSDEYSSDLLCPVEGKVLVL
jgi:hypothetical protein